MQALHSAKLGLKAQEQRVSTIADNIANVNTYGFKSRRTDFQDALYTELIDPSNPQSTENLQRGTGVLTAATSRDMTQGTQVQTGQSLDLYIDGDGFFMVQDPGGAVQYTRSGYFGVSTAADGRYLVTAEGHYVLDSEMNRISLPQGAELAVDRDGTIRVDQRPVATLGVASFANAGGLETVGGGCYAQTVASGAPVASDAQVGQGVLEASNVDLAVELTRLVRAQRAFALTGRAVSVWDEMEQGTNNLRV